jgi:hypothetical protein
MVALRGVKEYDGNDSRPSLSYEPMHGHFFRLGIAFSIFTATLMVRAEEKPAAPIASDFVRFREDAKGAQLQTAIVTYRNAEGVVVDLIGAIHIGDKSYYDALNKRFTTYEELLYEMVGEDLEAIDEPDPPIRKPLPPQRTKPGAAPQPAKPGEPSLEERVRAVEEFLTKGEEKPRRNFAPKAPPPDEAPAEQAAHDRLSWLHPLYDTLKNTLKLESQMEDIDYSKKNFVHADMTARQFATLQEQRGEGFLQMWWRAVQAQVAQPEATPNSPGLLKILEILCRPDSPTELKRLMGRMFDQVERIMSGMETDKGSVIVVERNKVALEVLKKEIAKGHKHLGIFYGAAHLTDMEQRLVSMGFKPEKSEWLTAWDLPPEPPPPVKAGTGVKPAVPPARPNAVPPTNK